MQGMTKNDSRALRDAEIDEGRNQVKSIKVLMIDKTTSFKKRVKGKKGNFKQKLSPP